MVTQLHPGDWNLSDDTGDFGETASISGDGQTMTVGHPGDQGAGLSPRAPPLIAGSESTGAVYVYRLTNSWKLFNMIKPNYAKSRGFGEVTTLSGSGKTLVVGVPGESSRAQGIDGDWANTGSIGSGALFVY